MTAKHSAKLLQGVRAVLAERSFSDTQITKLLPRLHEQHIEQPKLLAEIIDCWNKVMGKAFTPEFMMQDLGSNISVETITPTASPPTKSLIRQQNVTRKINMTNILADIEPDLLLFSPEKLQQRHEKIIGLGLLHSLSENWLLLFNAPRGFYLQDWSELTKKIYYIDQKVLDLLYDKKEQREMQVHPIVKSAAVTEADFDHIRTRYLFAARTGYKELSHMHKVQTALTRPSIKDLILSEDVVYLERFAPFCTDEEFSCFSNLIKNHELDEDDADMFQELAELHALTHEEVKQRMTTLSHQRKGPKS